MPEMTEVKAPFRGLNRNLNSQAELADAVDCLNVIIEDGAVTKRPGWAQDVNLSAGGKILGIFDYLKADSAKEFGIDRLGIVKAGTKVFKVDGWIATEIGSALGLSETELAAFAMVNNKVYFCDSVKFKVTDGTDVLDSQITRPGASATLGSSAGSLSGTYDYKVTWYSSTWGQESCASAVSATITVVDKQIDLSAMSGTRPDTRVDKKRIYRRKVSAYETTWKYVGEVAHATTTFTDNVLDVDLDPLRIAPLSYADALPNFRYLCWQAGVLFAAGSDDAATRLYFTRADMPWTMDQYMEVGSGHDTDRITGLASFQGMVVVFKERSIWLLSGNTVDTFYLRKVIPGIGGRSHHGIVDMGEALLFVSEDGFYAFDGAAVSKIGGGVEDPIQAEITDRNYSRDRYIVGVRDYERSMVVWSYTSSGGTENDRCLCYFYENSRLVNFPSWTKWIIGNPTYLGMLTLESTGKRACVLGFDDGLVGRLGGNSDNGVDIEWKWKTPPIDLDVPTMQKAFGELAVEVGPLPAASNMEVRFYRNDDVSPTTLFTFDQTVAVARRRMARSARQISLEFYGQTSLAAKVISFILESDFCGRA
jgi:hypothetical protein